jgi:hypothetical protein
MTCSANIRHKSERNRLSLFWTQFQFTNGPGCHPSTAYARWVRPRVGFLPPARARGERVKFGASRFLDGRGARPHLGRGGCLHGTRGYILLALEVAVVDFGEFLASPYGPGRGAGSFHLFMRAPHAKC